MQDLQAARSQRRRELRQQLTARRSLVELLTQPDTSIDDLKVEPVHADPMDKETPKATRTRVGAVPRRLKPRQERGWLKP